MTVLSEMICHVKRLEPPQNLTRRIRGVVVLFTQSGVALLLPGDEIRIEPVYYRHRRIMDAVPIHTASIGPKNVIYERPEKSAVRDDGDYVVTVLLGNTLHR